MTSETSQKSILKLNLEGNPVLRHVLEKTDTSQNLEWDKISALMHRTMLSANGIGLAANQVNVGLRMFVLNNDAKTFINPQIIEKSDETQTQEEGCLSFPNLFFTVTRPKSILVSWTDEQLKPQVDRFEGIWAQCIQHEIDHLNGVLFVDYASKFKLKRAREKQKKTNDTSRR